jgi:hypothetical protein
LGIHRPRESGTYGEEDKLLVARFLPHLQRALRIREQLGAAALQRQVSLETLERTDTAVFLVTSDGSIIFANPQGEGLIASGAGIRSCKGRLTAASSKDAELLGLLIREACDDARKQPRAEGIMSIRRAHQRPLSVLVAPFRLTWAGQPTAGAIVFLRDPNSSLAATAALQVLF